MKNRHKALFITIVPSPYQRDLFEALAARDDIALSVYYMEKSSPDSPWPEKPLRSYERVLPGRWFSVGGARLHVNWNFPDLSQPDFTILSTYASLTGQRLMRLLQDKRWLFWGERLNQNSGWKGVVQKKLLAGLSHASGIVGIGRAAENDYRRRFPKTLHFSIPYHCNLEPFFEIQHSRKCTPLRFLFCGQMIARKGIDLLLMAFDRLISAGNDAQLLLVGREAELPELLGRMSPFARSKVTYAGFQAPELLADFFSQCHVFVLPSRHDGWGVVVNQALGAGLPIIASDAVGAGLDLVENGRNGLLVGAGNVDELHGAMLSFVKQPDLANRWGQCSREKALNLTPEAGAKKWAEVFDTLAAEHHVRSPRGL